MTADTFPAMPRPAATRLSADRALTVAQQARAQLDAHLAAGREGALPMAALARTLGVSVAQLGRCFREAFGLTPLAYLRAQRSAAFRAALRRGTDVTVAAFDAGYAAPSRAYADVTSETGMSPGRYGRGGVGMQIGWATRTVPLGVLLIGATPRGLCWVSIGDDPGALLHELHAEYPRADIREAAADSLDAVLDAVEARLRGERRPAPVEIDMPVTAFHWRVLQALTTIPVGETRSYAQIAAQVGSPGAARAVANACATNTVAVVIPCHRVIHSDGSMSGYRWGNAVKRALLDAEGAPAPRGTAAEPAAVRRRQR